MSKKDIILTDSQRKALSKEAAIEVYIPKAMQYGLGKIPPIPDEYPDGSRGVSDVKKMVKGTIFSLFDELVVERHFDSDFERLLKHFRWTADRFGLDKSRLNGVNTADELKEVWADIFWSVIEPKLRNPALFEFFNDALAINSVSFWSFLVAAPGGAAIETAYGYMLDPVGRYRKVPDDDPLQVWRKAVNTDSYDRGFSYQVCRDNFTAAIAVESKPESVAVFGGGWLPEWHFPEIIRSNLEIFVDTKFFVCDSDKKIDPVLIMSNLPKEISANMEYKIQDIATSLKELAIKQQLLDMAILKGVASFMTKEQLVMFLTAALQLLHPGGKLIFDLQLNHFTMIRNALIVSWGDGSNSAKINLMIEPAARNYALCCLNMAAAKLWKEPAYWNSCNVRIESDVSLDGLDGSDDSVGIIVVVERPHFTTT